MAGAGADHQSLELRYEDIVKENVRLRKLVAVLEDRNVERENRPLRGIDFAKPELSTE